jgi:hypothetical protein
MSAHDAEFGNDWPDGEQPEVVDETADDYRPWNCDAGILPSLADEASVFAGSVAVSHGAAYESVVAASQRVSQWFVIAAAGALEHVAAVLDDISLSMENMVQSARATASSAIDESCWE